MAREALVCNSVVNGTLGRVAVLVAAMSSLRCAPDDRSAGEPVTIKSADLIRQTIHAGEQADVFVRVEPRSRCTVRGAELDALVVFSDGRGVATFFVYADKAGATLDLSLTCTDRAQLSQPVQYPIQVTSVADEEETRAPTAWLNDLP